MHCEASSKRSLPLNNIIVMFLLALTLIEGGSFSSFYFQQRGIRLLLPVMLAQEHKWRTTYPLSGSPLSEQQLYSQTRRAAVLFRTALDAHYGNARARYWLERTAFLLVYEHLAQRLTDSSGGQGDWLELVQQAQTVWEESGFTLGWICTKTAVAGPESAVEGAILDLDFSCVAAGGEDRFAIARTGQMVVYERGHWRVPIQLSTTCGTVRVVVKPPDSQLWSSDYQFNIVNRWTPYGGLFIRKYVKEDEPRLQFLIRNREKYSFVYTVAVSDWNHNRPLDLALAWNDNNAWAYIDGKMVKSTDDLQVEEEWDAQWLTLGGEVSRAMVFTRSLSEQEILGLAR